MRELKFRAWSNEHNRYCDLVTLIEDGKWVGWIKGSGVYLTTTDIVLEQYTGLKDKNGKEIYEGDIVECSPYSGRPIVFEEGRYWLGEELEDLFAGSLRSDVEVIGNIHENHELLEEE